jgi:hypothetical protein
MIINAIGFLGGFLLSNIIDTTLGEFNEWAIVGAALVVASLELISKFFYLIRNKLKSNVKTNLTLLRFSYIINNLKLGILYGLIVDAFKLGS